MKYIGLNWTLALKFSIGKKKRIRDCRILMTHDCICLYVMHMSEFVFCQTQISVFHISAYENDFHLKFWGWSNWPPILLHTKFQVSSSPGTCFSKIQIWPKSAVNPILNVLQARQVNFLLCLDLTSGLCRAVFPVSVVSPIGLPAYWSIYR